MYFKWNATWIEQKLSTECHRIIWSTNSWKKSITIFCTKDKVPVITLTIEKINILLFIRRLFFQYCALPGFFHIQFIKPACSICLSLFWTWITLLNTSSRRHFYMLIHAVICAYVPTEASSATCGNSVYVYKKIYKKKLFPTDLP